MHNARKNNAKIDKLLYQAFTRATKYKRVKHNKQNKRKMEEFLPFLTIMTIQKQNNTNEWNPQSFCRTQRKNKTFAIWQVESE